MNVILAQALADEWRGRLGLADWDVRVLMDPPKAGNRAEVEGWASRRMAAIRIAPEAPDAALSRVVVHELLHLWLDQLQGATRMLSRHTPPAVDDAFEVRWDEVEHQLIAVLEGQLTGDPYIVFGDSPEWTQAWRMREV